MFFKIQYECAIVKVGPRDFEVVPPSDVQSKWDRSFGFLDKGKYAGSEYLDVSGKARSAEKLREGIGGVVDKILSTTEEPEIPLEELQNAFTYYFDMAKETFGEVDPMPRGRCCGVAGVIDNMLYLAGGFWRWVSDVSDCKETWGFPFPG